MNNFRLMRFGFLHGMDSRTRELIMWFSMFLEDEVLSSWRRAE